jgi:hypothetical protein
MCLPKQASAVSPKRLSVLFDILPRDALAAYFLAQFRRRPGMAAQAVPQCASGRLIDANTMSTGLKVEPAVNTVDGRLPEPAILSDFLTKFSAVKTEMPKQF